MDFFYDPAEFLYGRPSPSEISQESLLLRSGITEITQFICIVCILYIETTNEGTLVLLPSTLAHMSPVRCLKEVLIHEFRSSIGADTVL